MLNHSVTSNTFIEDPQSVLPSSTHLTISHAGNQFRVLAREYHKHHSIVFLWCLFWLTTTLILTSLLVADFQHYSKTGCLGMITLSGIILSSYVLLVRGVLPKYATLSVLNLTVTAVLVLTIRLLNLQCVVFAMLQFAATQTIISVKFIGQIGRLICQTILVGQLLLIGLKLDLLIEWNWNIIMVPVLFGFFLSSFALFFVFLYSIVLNWHYPANYAAKKYSLLFLGLTLGCVSTIFLIPTCWVAFDFSPALLCIPAMGATSSNAIFLFIYSKQMALFLCRHKEVVQQGQQAKKMRLTLTNSPAKGLSRLSQNWFSLQSEGRKMQKGVPMPECVICADGLSEILWLPCGHLAVCVHCCQQMVHNQMHQCVICKQKPSSLSRINIDSTKEHQLTHQISINPEITRTYDIVEHYQIMYE